MNTSEKLLSAVNERLGRSEPLTASDCDTTFSDLGIDSLDRMLIVVAVQEGFGLSIPDEALPQLQTLSALTSYIEKNG